MGLAGRGWWRVRCEWALVGEMEVGAEAGAEVGMEEEGEGVPGSRGCW